MDSAELPAVPGLARRLARDPHAHWWLTIAALLMASPSMFAGLELDDYVLQLLSRADAGIAGLHSHPWLLFSFTSGNPQDNHALMDTAALLPWWADVHHLNAFLRPLAALTHRLDFALWPDQPWLMHVHSLLWFAALLLVVAHVYRKLEHAPAGVALLAFGLFAFDGSHGMTVTWIANRNALVSVTLALPALSAHHRWLAQGWKPGMWLGPLCFALGLCAGESAVAVLGYLLAYAIVLDTSPIPRRALHLSAYVLLLLAWRAVFTHLGLGSAGSGGYHDPGREPLAYAISLLNHLPVLLSAELGVPLADVWFWGPPSMHAPIWVVSVITLLVLAAAGHVLLARDREARFWAAGMLISGCAVAASVPGERLLLVPSIGAAVFVAKLVRALWPMAYARKPLPWLLLFFLCALHFVIEPIMMPVRAFSMRTLHAAIARTDQGIPSTPDVRDETVVVVNAPFDLMVSYLQIAREARGVPRPRHLYWLASASSPIDVQTRDASTLRVRPERGFMLTPPERHYRADPTTLTSATPVELSEMSVHIVGETPDRRPAAADFRFKAPLDAPRYRFLRWEAGRLLPFTPPPPGRTAHFAREAFYPVMFKQAFGADGS